MISLRFSKIGFGWAIITFLGLSGFVYAKKDVDARRFEHMQIRERMRRSNSGEYEPITDRNF